MTQTLMCPDWPTSSSQRLRHLVGELFRVHVVDTRTVDENAHFASVLQSEGVVDAGMGRGDFLDLFESPDVLFHFFLVSPRSPG